MLVRSTLVLAALFAAAGTAVGTAAAARPLSASVLTLAREDCRCNPAQTTLNAYSTTLGALRQSCAERPVRLVQLAGQAARAATTAGLPMTGYGVLVATNLAAPRDGTRASCRIVMASLYVLDG